MRTTKAKVKKKKTRTRGKIVKELDAVFSKRIRQKHTKRGIVECYTCGKKDDPKNMQNGHFVSRAMYKYRRDENNCRPQCVGCNMFKGGNYKIYTIKMIDELGREAVENMMNDKELGNIPTRKLEEMIEYYRGLLK